MQKAPNTDSFPEGLSQPALRALASAGYMTLEQVAGASRKALLALHGFGPKAIPVLEEGLKKEELEPLTP